MICPRCNNTLHESSIACNFCGYVINAYAVQRNTQQLYAQNAPQYQQVPQQIKQPQYQQPVYHQPQIVYDATKMMMCPTCGRYMARTANICPGCGNPRPVNVVTLPFLDVITMIALVLSLLFSAGGMLIPSFGIMFTALIVYWIIYENGKYDPDKDMSKVKQSLNIITVIFILTFCIQIVFIF